MEQVDLLLFQSERRAIYGGDGSGTESTGARGEGVEGYGQRDRRWERLQREPTFTGLRRGITGLPCFENEVKAIADFPLIEAEEARFSLLYAQAAPIWREA